MTYKIINNKVYFNNYLIKIANPKTFKVLKNGYAKDNLRVYFKADIIKNCDVNSFKSIKYEYAKDKNYFYSSNQKIKGIDIKTVKILNNNYFKDKNSLYFHTKKIKLNLEELKIFENYVKDEKHVYYYSRLMKTCDSKTFKPIDQYFSKDKNYVYFEENPYIDADPKSFKKILSKKTFESYYKDNLNVYTLNYNTNYIIDAQSFEVLDDYYVKDKNNIYYNYLTLVDCDYNTFKVLKDGWAEDKNGTIYKNRRIRKEDLILENIRNNWIYQQQKSFMQLICDYLKIKDKKIRNISNDKILKIFDPMNILYKNENKNYWTFGNTYEIDWPKKLPKNKKYKLDKLFKHN